MRWSHAPIETVPTYDIAVRRLRRQIQLAQLLPGERLPAERMLAGHLGVSRMTLREALRVLETEQFITIKRGTKGGAFVCSAATLDQIATARLVRDPADTMRAMEFRQTLEPAAARLAADRRTPADLKQMEITSFQCEDPSNRESGYRMQVQFHLSMVGAAHNRWMLEAVTDSIAALFLPSRPADDDDVAEAEQCARRRQIIDHLRRRDGESAASEIKTLLAIESSRIQTKIHLDLPSSSFAHRARTPSKLR